MEKSCFLGVRGRMLTSHSCIQRSGEMRNQAVADSGQSEITTGQFSHATKNREGVVPGADHEVRRNQGI